ncbi:MAG TPA: neuraminidase-like domain-containing protein, partial [Nitrolancea sp.]|nr:neuraminidase-like domain-containing protein [Nitrolancea sp.]
YKPAYDQNKDLLGKDRADLTPAQQQRFDQLTSDDRDHLKWVRTFEEQLAALKGQFAASGVDDPQSWLETELQHNTFARTLVLADPDAGGDFSRTTLRFADGTPADDFTFLKINLFVRLWRKLGWTIDEVDRSLQTFIPASAPFVPDNLDKRPLMTALISMAHLKRLGERNAADSGIRQKLLALWADIPTRDRNPLYAQLFLKQSVLKSGEVFDAVNGKTLSVFDDYLGEYLTPDGLKQLAGRVRFEASAVDVAANLKLDHDTLTDESTKEKLSVSYDDLNQEQRLAYIGVLTDQEKANILARGQDAAQKEILGKLLDSVQQAGRDFSLIAGHMTALQGALGLNADDIVRILADVGLSPETAELSLANVSLLYRYGLLAAILQLPVRDLITLKALSGLNPFMPLHPDPLDTLEHDHPFDQTWRFVEIADLVSGSGLAIQDLDYLLRHRFDPSGPYRPDDDATRLMLATLAAAIAKIRADNAVPAATDTVTEEALRQKLGAGLAPEVVETFMTMVNGKSTLSAGQQKEFFANHLQEQALRVDGEVGFLKEDDFQTLFAPLEQLKALQTFDPADTDDEIADKEAQNATISAQNAEIEKQNNASRETRRHRIAEAFLPYLQRQLISALVSSTIGTQLGADPSLVATLLSNVNLVRYPAAAGQALLESFQGIDRSGVEADFFDAPDLSGARQATSATIASADTDLKDAKDSAGHDLGAANSARFSGYLVVPAHGSYRFYVALEKNGARAALRFDHLAAPVFDRATGADNSEIGDQPDEYVELEPGIPYGFTLDLTGLNGGSARVFVRGETLPKAPLSQLTLYPRAGIDRASTALLLLRKVLQLSQTLGLDEREIRYFADHAADFGGLDLSTLATRDALAELETIAASLRRDNPGLSLADAMEQARQANPTLADEASWPGPLFQQFLHLARYARLKQEMAGGADDLIGVFEAANIDQSIPENADKVYSLIAGLTRRDPRTVKEVARAFPGVPAIKDDLVLRRVWDALQIVDSLGVSVADLRDWTRIVAPNATDAERFSIAHDLKEAVKAHLDQAAWQRVAQPIFDKLRQRQRDALSAYIMHRNKFERPEQLYEYFLIDPGMEPVVQTSRIRLAISSVQLFIQRCLLNLEREVPPSMIQSDQWEWMKHYRVWEANRKIFLYPENWLEPEFRDDKTHLFNELESTLLQGDVSNDLVEDAFLTYLRKLEELARLAIVAMHLEDAADPADRVLHVIGRTHSQPYKYFYRRYLSGAWTPWEPVTAEISGDHLAPVVWRDRLYLFWVTFVVKPEEPKLQSQSASSTAMFSVAVSPGLVKSTVASVVKDEPPITDLTLSQISASAASTRGGFTVEAHLNWSEYLQGEWSTRETGGSPDTSPVVITGQTSFDPSSVFIYVSKEPESDGSGGVFIHLSNPFRQSFYLAGRNSVPVKAGIVTAPRTPFNVGIPTATHYLSGGKLSVTFRQRITTIGGVKQPDAVTTSAILGTTGTFTLLACDNDLDFVADANDSAAEIAGLIKPVFFQDQSVNLFLEPSVDEQTIDDWKEWVTRTTVPDGIVDAPDIDWLKDHVW